MSFYIEKEKMRRTGILPAFLTGGSLAGLVPVLNMAVRWEIYADAKGSPAEILLDANWQMMGMLNLLLLVAGACMLYHNEFADHAMQRLETLPIRQEQIFFDKACLLGMLAVLAILLEGLGLLFCLKKWFVLDRETSLEIIKSMGYAWVLLLPSVLGLLLIASLCTNIWMSLGIGVIGVFLATMLPTDKILFSMFPLALPFQMLPGTETEKIRIFLAAVLAEGCLFLAGQRMCLRIRRFFS